jgi:hypothetical protein
MHTSDHSVAVAIFANGTYFVDTPRISIFLDNNTETGTTTKQKQKQDPSNGQKLFRRVEGKIRDDISNAVFEEGGIHNLF